MKKKQLTRRRFIGDLFKTGALLAAPAWLGPPRIFFSAPFDLIIRGGQVADGLGNSLFSADIGIVGDRIEEIGSLKSVPAGRVIEAGGRIVSPGFIDIHSHTDLELLINPKAESKIRQGVTTELSGNCGGSAFPGKTDETDEEDFLRKELGPEARWTDLKGFYSLLAKKGTALNYATLVGHATLREHVMGNARRKPTAEEMAEMTRLAREAMAHGAFGLSTGLEYMPGGFAEPEEVIELCRAVSECGGFYATHVRSEDTQVMEAVAEALHIARSGKLPLQLSHFKACGRSNYYKQPMLIDLIERARERGLEVTADAYPYTAYSTTMNIWFPSWAHAGGLEKFVERLKDNESRQKMKEETLAKVEGDNSWESIMISGVENLENKALIGRRVDEAARERGQDPYEFVCDLLISEKGSVDIIGFGMSQENTELVLKHPLVMLCSDGNALAPYGILNRNRPHPRNYGAFPRFLSLYVRERKILPLTEAIKKMTSMPAKKMGLKKRGILQKGAFADIVIFDPEKIEDRATYVEPTQYPSGIDYVLVNGKIVVDHGEHTGEMPGQILHGPGSE